MSYVKEGMKAVLKHPALLLLLFLYQWLWGTFFYRFMESIVVPLLYRFPPNELPKSFFHVFLAESQFQLTKTALAYPYLAVFLGVVLIRMLLTPLLQAGVFSSMHLRPSAERGKGFWKNSPFVRGIREKGKKFFLLYWLQAAAMFAPLFWLIPHWMDIFREAPSLKGLLFALLPSITGYFLYLFLLRLFFIYWLWGIATERSFGSACKVFLLRFPTVAGIAFLLFAVYAAAALLTAAASLVWAGFAALVVHQAYPLLRVLFQLWNIGAHYRFWISTAS